MIGFSVLLTVLLIFLNFVAILTMENEKYGFLKWKVIKWYQLINIFLLINIIKLKNKFFYDEDIKQTTQKQKNILN